MNYENIEWIFFDIGGVIADESKFQKIRENYDLEIIKIFEPFVNKEDILSVWPQASRMSGDLDINVITLVLKDKNNLIKAINLLKQKKSGDSDYYDLLEIRPETLKIIPQLAKKYKLGIIANQNPLARKKIEELGLNIYFKSTTVSSDYKLEKPNPELFKKIFEITGADPSKSIMIDDNIERGLVPAKNLGMVTIWYKLKEREKIPKNIVDEIIVSLNDLTFL